MDTMGKSESLLDENMEVKGRWGPYIPLTHMSSHMWGVP